jgi:hypothetical protein
MKTRFNQKAYRHRIEVETEMSMLKRNLGTYLRGRTDQSRRPDVLLMMVGTPIVTRWGLVRCISGGSRAFQSSRTIACLW